MSVVVPDSLLLSFFQEASSTLLDDKSMFLSLHDDDLLPTMRQTFQNYRDRQLHHLGCDSKQAKYTTYSSSPISPSAKKSPIPTSKSSDASAAATTLEICRRKVLDQQRLVLQRVVKRYTTTITTNNSNHENETDSDGAACGGVSYVQVQERLGALQQRQQQHSTKKLSLEMKVAMDHMTECARLALCNMVLYVECYLDYCHGQQQEEEEAGQHSRPSRRQRFDISPSTTLVSKMKLTEYFQLCQTSLKLPRVQQFIRHGRCPLFDNNEFFDNSFGDEAEQEGSTTISRSVKHSNDSKYLSIDDENYSKFDPPRKRVEYTQRLMSQGMGWEPDFLTQQLVLIFVEKDTTTGNDDHHDHRDRISTLRNDPELRHLFEQTVAMMEGVIVEASSSSSSSSSSPRKGRDTSTSISGKSNIKDLNDTSEGGVTRVVSVQYSEIEITPDGRRINVISAAPGTLDRGRDGGIQRDDDSDDNDNDFGRVRQEPHDPSRVSVRQSEGTGIVSGVNRLKLSDEEQKRRIRVASDAAMLQQEILDSLYAMDEDERIAVLSDAADANERFQQELMMLPPGQNRINFLTSIPSDMSRKLAMHKLWTAAVSKQSSDGTGHR